MPGASVSFFILGWLLSWEMRSFVFTLGFHEDLVIRRLTFKAARPGEPILVFTAEPLVGGVERAFSALRDYCSRVGLSDPSLVTLPSEDIPRALVVARAGVAGLPEPVVAELGGGMRYLLIIVFTALLLEHKGFELYVTHEGGGGELHMPSGVLRALRGLSEEKMRMLKVIASRPGIGVEALARTLAKSPKTVRNHLTDLKRMGLVASSGRGAPLRLTTWGNAIVAGT